MTLETPQPTEHGDASRAELMVVASSPRADPSSNGTAAHIDVAAVFRGAITARTSTSARATTKTTTRTLTNVAAGVAHDLANLLVVMGIDLDLLASEPLSLGGADAIGSLRAQTSYLRNLARDLRMATVEWEVRDATPRTDLAAWWRDTGVLLLAAHGHDVVIRADIPRDLPAVCIEPHDLTQVVLNLVGNAAHAIVDARSQSDRRPAEIRIIARLAGHGLGVVLTVADNGPGMGRDVLTRACEPFFTTRAGRGGTGLGLLMVQRLVGDVGGKVHLSSALGVGTTVTVELAASPSREILSGDAPAPARAGIEDETDDICEVALRKPGPRCPTPAHDEGIVRMEMRSV